MGRADSARPAYFDVQTQKYTQVTRQPCFDDHLAANS